MLSDIEIAQQCKMLPIAQIAEKAHVPEEALEPYGRYKAKIDPALVGNTGRKAKLVLVTAMTNEAGTPFPLTSPIQKKSLSSRI